MLSELRAYAPGQPGRSALTYCRWFSRVKESATNKRNRPLKAQTQPNTGAPFPEAVSVPAAGDTLRRALLAMLTALIIARPALRGESLGLVSDLSDPTGLIWMALVLLGCAAWAGWRMATGRVEVTIGRVETALLIGVGLLFLAVGSAAYQRAALLACWEWVGLLALLFLARQLAVSEREKHGLFAVLLATGVALSAQAIYQRAWELPRTAAQAVDFKDGPRAWVSRQYQLTFESLNDAEREALTQRLLRRNAHASYLYPSSLAAVLTLLASCLVAAVVITFRGQAETWQKIFASACALLAVLALFFTGEWLAMLAALLVSVPLVSQDKRLGWVAGCMIAGGLGLVFYLTGILNDTLQTRSEAWAATWKLIQDGRLWTGIGPGHFGYYHPAYMSESDTAVSLDAQSALLDLWASGGFLVPLAFIVAAAFVMGSVARWWRVTNAAERNTAVTPGTELPWEFYLGGMFGVLCAFVLRTSSLVEADILNLALLAALGSLAWFAAYALFEQIVWTPAERVTALSAGITAMGLTVLTGSGMDRPAVMALLAVAVALLLAHVEPVPWPLLSRTGPALSLPIPVFLGGALAFLLMVVVPTGNTAAVIRKARLGGFMVRSYYQLDDANRTIKDPISYMRNNILEPLRVANLEEKGVIRTNMLLAEWHAELWARTLLDQEADDVQRRAIAYARQATDLCSLPNGRDDKGQPITKAIGTEGLLTEYTVRLIFVQRMLAIAAQLDKEANDPKMPTARKNEVQRVAASRRSQARDAARRWSMPLIEAALKADPTNPRMAFLLAQVWDLVGDRQQRSAAVAEALRLNGRVGEPRRLTNAQRGQLEEWEKNELPK